MVNDVGGTYKFKVMFDIAMAAMRKGPSGIDFQFIAERLAAALAIERCVIAKINRDDGIYEFVAGVAISGPPHTLGVNYRIEDCPPIVEVLRTKKMRLVDDMMRAKCAECYYMRGLIEDIDIKSILFVPVLDDQDEVSFVIILDAIREKRCFNDVEIEFVNDIATIVDELPNYGLRHERERRILMLGEMSAAIAHEIRNPIHLLGGFANRAYKIVERENIQNEDLRRCLRLSIEGSARLNLIVKNILTYPQMDVNLNLEKTDVKDLLRSLLDTSDIRAFSKSVPIRLKGAGDCFPAMIDCEKFELVFRNLITNAIQHIQTLGLCESAPERYVGIVIKRSGATIEVTISNPGTLGVDNPEKIFEEFFTTKPDGLGIGLTIVKRIIMAHREHQNISIRVFKRGGRVEFVIRFPLAE